MAQEAPIPVQPEADLTTASIAAFLNQFNNAMALSVVKQSFFEAEVFRAQNIEARWTRNEALYLGKVPQKTWNGTSVPRSSVSYSLVADQVEAALPMILQALFSQPDWFEVTPKNETTLPEALQIRDQLLYQLENPGEGMKPFKAELEQVVKDMLIKGNGYVTLEYNPATKYIKPSYRDIRDIYIDPGCSDPLNLDAARYVILRDTKTIDEIRSWRNLPKMNMPSDEQLAALARQGSLRRADQLKQQTAQMTGSSETPAMQNLIPDAAGHKLEILTYYSKKQIVVTIGTEWVLFSEENPFGFFPGASCVCAIINGQHYGMSIADRQSDIQGTVAGLINAHLDELALSVNPPRGQGSSATGADASSKSLHPGQVWSLKNPKTDLNFFTPSGATQNVFQSIQFLIQTADARTGFDSAAGKFKPGNANRTLGGMQMQQAGGFTRISLLVQHVEDMLTQMLHKMLRMTSIISGSGVFLPAQAGERQSYLVNSSTLGKPVNVCIRAASQMLTREKLMGILPVITQFYTQPNFQQGLAESDLKINWPEMFRFVQQATGVEKQFEFVVPLTPEEKQARMQPPPEAVMQAQQAERSDNVRLQLGQMKAQTEIQKTVLSKQPDPTEGFREQQKLEIERQKAEMEAAMQEQKLQFEAQMQAMKLQAEQAKMALAAQKAQLDQIIAQTRAQTDLRVNEIKGEQALRQGEQNLVQQEANAAQATRHAEEAHASKLKMQEAGPPDSKARSK